uniref:Tubulin polymerization promoting protein family member 2 n=1 Tax=Anser cygnoides TaxID=8845 RepID=A0A8B9E057_ANSCY
MLLPIWLPWQSHGREMPVAVPFLLQDTSSKMSGVEDAFRKFAVYGDTAASGNEMTGKNFSKMCKECGVMDGKAVTSTDIDIVFNKVKTKGARTITFAEFQQAMKELCGKRFKGKSPQEALQALYGLIEGKEPGSAGTTVSRSFLAYCAPGAAVGPHVPRAILACREEPICDLTPNAGCLLLVSFLAESHQGWWGREADGH